jgi:hypothetical protein
MRVTLARNCGNNIVEHIIFDDPYRASNFYETYCGKVAGVVKCESIYTIGAGEHREENCFNCPLHHCCLCENRKFTDENGTKFYVSVWDTTKKSNEQNAIKKLEF